MRERGKGGRETDRQTERRSKRLGKGESE